MTINPAVSVIVPMYKVERYIKLCVDSILAQTFQDFEIILVDDASPDACFELCQKLYGDNPKVKLVRHEKNLGLGESRNTGMRHARGKYVYFVDSDDFILSDALEKFYAAAERNNAEVVHAAGRYELVQNDGDPVGEGTLTLKWDGYSREGFLKNDIVYRLDKHWRTYGTRSNAWLLFCRRDFLERNQIEFLPIISEDEPFNFALFCTAERYYILRAAFYVHLLRGDSIMRAYDIDRFSQGVYGMLIGSAYIKNLLDQVQKFDGCEIWRENIMMAFFKRFSKNHTLPFYGEDEIPAEVNATAEKIFQIAFGESAAFVKYFFNNYHVFRRQTEFFAQQNQLLLDDSKRRNNLMSLFIREQPALLELMNEIKTADKTIFLLGTSDHGNLGDHAIAWGERVILQEYFPDHAIIEISRDYLTGELGELVWGLGLERYMRQSDLIALIGGGNLGNLWIGNEIVRRLVIDKFPDKKIVIFPQSIYFTQDDDGRKELALSQRIYNAHKDLHLMTRDENSFELAQKIFPEINNYLMPDAATALHGLLDDVDVEREGVLFVLRGDKEKVRDDGKIKTLQESFAAANIPFDVIDTVIKGKVTAKEREQKIRDVLMKIRKSKLVVTDRFHGVIFSFITRTPVLAFKSFDTKISSGIKWFENFRSVFYAENKSWASIEEFINLALGDSTAFEELNPSVKIDSKQLFAAALDEIVGTNEIVSVQYYTPPSRH